MATSIRIFILNGSQRCQQDDFDVHPDGPMLQVKQVVFDAAFHFVQCVGLASVAANLRPTGNAGFDLVPQ